MSETWLLLPNQLVEEAGELEDIILWEHPQFFEAYDYHVQKLLLHRASMQAFQDRYETGYIGLDEEPDWEDYETVHVYDPVNHGLREGLEAAADEHDIELIVHETPTFLATRRFNRSYFEDNAYHQLSYYRAMRERYDVLVEQDGSPVGGKWSFDPENREKLPEDHELPVVPSFSSEYVEEAEAWVRERFPDAPGSMDGFRWPTTREQAREQLDRFLEERLEQFGRYQDAFEPDLDYGYHSLLSSSLNIGLLTPEEVIEATLEAHENHGYPINSLEGFLRQIMGWREYVRALYQLEPQMAQSNELGHDRPVPPQFYTAETGFEPVDRAIERTLENAYTHHIERLMVLGNIMLLLGTHPDAVHDWFMELYIDAYEWVMVPNIYGMSQYAWPEMMTKPYVSSSNYVGKMSHYTGDWEDDWDSLYWAFIDRHSDLIEEIPRMKVMLSHLDRMGEETLQDHRQRSEEVIHRLMGDE